MKVERRQKAILDYLDLHEKEDVETLMKVMGVSPATIRRDLSFLEKQGKVIREYGKVKRKTEKLSLNYDSELSVSKKKDIHQEEKRKIAMAASSFVEDGQCIYIDSGTTPAYLYDYIKHYKITIFTNNLLLVGRAHPKDKAKIVFGPGEFDPIHYTLLGTKYMEMLQQFHFDACFIGASGYDEKRKRLTCTNLESSSYKRNAMMQSDKCYVLADASKRFEQAILCFAKFDEVDCIITNKYDDNKLENFMYVE